MKTNKEKNREMYELLMDLAGELQLEQLEGQLTMTYDDTPGSRWDNDDTKLGILEHLNDKYNSYRKRAEVLTELHGYFIDEAVMPYYTYMDELDPEYCPCCNCQVGYALAVDNAHCEILDRNSALIDSCPVGRF